MDQHSTFVLRELFTLLDLHLSQRHGWTDLLPGNPPQETGPPPKAVSLRTKDTVLINDSVVVRVELSTNPAKDIFHSRLSLDGRSG
jgi:hypothetical protein